MLEELGPPSGRNWTPRPSCPSPCSAYEQSLPLMLSHQPFLHGTPQSSLAWEPGKGGEEVRSTGHSSRGRTLGPSERVELPKASQRMDPHAEPRDRNVMREEGRQSLWNHCQQDKPLQSLGDREPQWSVRLPQMSLVPMLSSLAVGQGHPLLSCLLSRSSCCALAPAPSVLSSPR